MTTTSTLFRGAAFEPGAAPAERTRAHLSRVVLFRLMLAGLVGTLWAFLPAAGSAQAPPNLDACRLLTAEEIGAIMGQAPGKPVSEPGKGLAVCRWPSADGRDRQMVHVQLRIWPLKTYQEYLQQARQEWGSSFKEENYRKVEGLGDFAVWVGGDINMLQVFRHGMMVVTSPSARSGRRTIDVSRSLVEKALARLPK